MFELQARIRPEEEMDDMVLERRVRSRIGGAVRHPGSIEVTAQGGHVILSGPVLADEVDRLMERVQSVRGVQSVEDRLDVHHDPGDIPGLQGLPARWTQKSEWMQEVWSPTARFAAGTAGGALTFLGVRRGGLLGALSTVAGIGILARAMTNAPMKRLTGIDAGRRAVDLQKTLNINAPVDQVYTFWSNYEYFPYFMSNVRSVQDLGEGRSHWVISGPADVPIEWDAVMTRMEPNRVLAWKTEPNAAIQHAGIIRFEPNPDGSTRVDIKLSYNPGIGALGHAVAALLGADPKRQMDEDLARMKMFIETGNLPHDAAAQEAIRAQSDWAKGE